MHCLAFGKRFGNFAGSSDEEFTEYLCRGPKIDRTKQRPRFVPLFSLRGMGRNRIDKDVGINERLNGHGAPLASSGYVPPELSFWAAISGGRGELLLSFSFRRRGRANNAGPSHSQWCPARRRFASLPSRLSPRPRARCFWSCAH